MLQFCRKFHYLLSGHTRRKLQHLCPATYRQAYEDAAHMDAELFALCLAVLCVPVSACRAQEGLAPTHFGAHTVNGARSHRHFSHATVALLSVVLQMSIKDKSFNLNKANTTP